MFPAIALLAASFVIQHEGRLLNADDTPVTGAHAAVLSIYPVATGGTVGWSDTFNVVLDKEGHYTLLIGDTDNGQKPISASDVGPDAKFLAVKFDNTQELVPRQRLGAAVLALSAITAGDAQTLGGHKASEFLLLGSGGSLGDSITAGTITATSKFVGTLEGRADTAGVANTAKAPTAEFTLDGAKLTGQVAAALVNGKVASATAADTAGALASTATVAGTQVDGKVASATSADTANALASSATVAASQITGKVASALVADSLAGQGATAFAPAFSRNLHPGGTFEDGGLYYWTVAEGSASNSTLPTIDTTKAHSGVASLKVFSGGTGSDVAGILIPVRAGQKLKVSAWATGNVTTGSSPTQKLYAVGRFYNAAGVLNGSDKSGCAVSATTTASACPDLDFTSPTSSWVQSSTTVNVPADATYFKILNLGILGTGSGTAWIDDVRVESDSQEDEGDPPLTGFKYARWDSNADYRNNTNINATGFTLCANNWCAVGSRTITFVKHRPDSVLRVTYSDTLGVNGASYGACNWAIGVTPGTTPVNPAASGANNVAIFSDADFNGSHGNGWTMSHAAHVGISSRLAPGTYTVQVWSNNAGVSECLMGWNQSGGSLSVEELISQN